MTREEAIKRLKEYAQYSYGIWHNDEEDTKAFDMAIEALTNVQNMHKGKWIIRDDMPKLDNTYSIECSECGQLMFGHYNADNPNFCCNCGARMESEKEYLDKTFPEHDGGEWFDITDMITKESEE